jgi:hypothetical protein
MGRPKGSLNKKTIKAIKKGVIPKSNIGFIKKQITKPTIKTEQVVKPTETTTITDDSSSLNAFKNSYGTPPVEGNEPPVEGNEPPVEGNEPPVEGNEPPVEGNEPPVEQIDYSEAEEVIVEKKADLKNAKDELARKKSIDQIKSEGGNENVRNMVFITDLVFPILISNTKKIGKTKEQREVINKIDNYDVRLTDVQKDRIYRDEATIETAEKWMPLIAPEVRSFLSMYGCYSTNFNDIYIELKDKLGIK